MKQKQLQTALLILFFVMTAILPGSQATAQNSTLNIRIARLVIDPAKLEAYKTALKEEIEASIRNESGVLSLYAVYDKNEPSHVTVFEIYASQEAYQSHIQTPHFKKYKAATADMVKSLGLAETLPIALGSKFESSGKQ